MNPKDLNSNIRREHYQIPTREEIISEMAGAKFFTKLDASQGFWQLKLHTVRTTQGIAHLTRPLADSPFLIPKQLCINDIYKTVKLILDSNLICAHADVQGEKMHCLHQRDPFRDYKLVPLTLKVFSSESFVSY